MSTTALKNPQVGIPPHVPTDLIGKQWPLNSQGSNAVGHRECYAFSCPQYTRQSTYLDPTAAANLPWISYKLDQRVGLGCACRTWRDVTRGPKPTSTSLPAKAQPHRPLRPCPSTRTHPSRQPLPSSPNPSHKVHIPSRSSPLHPPIPRQQRHPLLRTNLSIRIHHPSPLPLLLAGAALLRSTPIPRSRARRRPDTRLGHPNKLVDVVATGPLPCRLVRSAAGVARRGAVVEVGRRRGGSARGSGGQREGCRGAWRRRAAGWEGACGRRVGLCRRVGGRAGGGVRIAWLWRGERGGLFRDRW